MSTYQQEHELQTVFIDWLAQQEGYRETFNDEHSDKNTSMDSVGFIGERPVLIEFKLTLSSEKRIEQKIYAALRALQGIEPGSNQKIRAALSAWNRTSVPRVIIVVSAISKRAQNKLKEMLAQRAQEWQFNCTFWVWKDKNRQERVLHLEQFDNYPQMGALPPIQTIPRIPSAKRSTLQFEEFAELAEHNGVGALFEAMIVRIKELRGIAYKGKTTINFRFRERGATPFGGVVSIRPGQSSTEKGLLIGYKLALLRNLTDETMLPGLPQEPKEGWLDKSRWLRTMEEVNLFWDIVTRTKQKE